MKKLFLFLTVTLMSCFGAHAQSSLIGTLSHDGEVTVYYGADALIKAHEAAEPGDVITLSAGTFTGLTITKAVTIRGAGMFPEDNGTIISNGQSNSNIYIRIEPNSNHLNLEGLYFSSLVMVDKADSPTFTKCQFGRNFTRGSGVYRGAYTSPTFINCFFIGKTATFCDDASTFMNCYLGNELEYSDQSSQTFNNCIFENIKYINSNFNVSNSIIRTDYTGFIINSAVILSSKVLSDEANCLRNCTAINSEVLPFNTECFKEGTRYELKDEFVNTWLGDDKTQIGIYGGTIPFDPTPTNPQITKFNVAKKTSADGKLSVDIEVSAAK